ncbi:MAG: DUF2203 domain-containing protein [Planctomycetales bacterium]
MSEEQQPRKLFTVEQANSMLPLVKAIAGDISRVSRERTERRERLALPRHENKEQSPESFREDPDHMEKESEALSQRWQELHKELTDLGVELKNDAEGLLDFPSMMDDRIVYLCWKLGEAEVLHWHELDAGFAGRQPLAAETASTGQNPPSS